MKNNRFVAAGLSLLGMILIVLLLGKIDKKKDSPPQPSTVPLSNEVTVKYSDLVKDPKTGKRSETPRNMPTTNSA